ncbi:putative lipoprotein [Pedobacter sp. BAL39]|uniref:SusE domain-containing protein n=1 Tax=Pedobacter sp. BAL39 TaxID=391596 RepID=UPI000155AD7B|nr:SusE domain-containing protein [Pedobacter sp. BAL39]EDM34336.1 putative lipoprotein [Pedobacter sp. BAL39]
MKSFIIKSVSLGMVVASLWSCKKDETRTVSTVAPAGTLTTSTTNVSLVQANAAATAFTLSFPAASVTGYAIPVTSTIQLDLKGRNFSAPTEVVLAGTSYAPKVSDFNAMLLALGAKIGTPAEIEVRLESKPSENAITYSNVITLNATAYSAASWVYAPGAYQGWAPETADSLVSPNSDGIYAGVLVITPGNFEFKITPVKSWTLSYGDAGQGMISSSASANLNALTAGLHLVTVDMAAKTFKIEDVKQWSIIGSATPRGWDFDTDMKFINDGKGTWKVTADLVAGAMKFRQAHDWGTNYGGSGGNAELGGGDIQVTAAGNYTITLDIPNLKYTLVKN